MDLNLVTKQVVFFEPSACGLGACPPSGGRCNDNKACWGVPVGSTLHVTASYGNGDVSADVINVPHYCSDCGSGNSVIVQVGWRGTLPDPRYAEDGDQP